MGAALWGVFVVSLTFALVNVVMSGCVLLIGLTAQLPIIGRNKINIAGTVTRGNAKGVKVGVFPFFEGDEGSGSFRAPGPDHVRFSKVALPDPDGKFGLEVGSPRKFANFVVFAWTDLLVNDRFNIGEVRSRETYAITKSGTVFLGALATASEIPPVATHSLNTYLEAELIPFRFTFPISGTATS